MRDKHRPAFQGPKADLIRKNFFFVKSCIENFYKNAFILVVSPNCGHFFAASIAQQSWFLRTKATSAGNSQYLNGIWLVNTNCGGFLAQRVLVYLLAFRFSAAECGGDIFISPPRSLYPAPPLPETVTF